MPLQLLELAVVIPRFIYKMFVRTPRGKCLERRFVSSWSGS